MQHLYSSSVSCAFNKVIIIIIIVLPIIRIELPPMREQTGFTVIQKRAQIHARVPVGREIVDSTFRQDSLKNTDEIRFEAN